MNYLSAQNKPLTVGRQKGIALVEFSVGVIVLLVVMLGVAEAGRAFYSFNTLTKSVRGGVRYIADNALNNVPAVDLTAQKITETQNMVVYGQTTVGTAVLPSLAPGDVDIAQTFPSGTINPYIQVTASYDYTPIFGVIPALGLGGESRDFAFTMKARSTMRVSRRGAR